MKRRAVASLVLLVALLGDVPLAVAQRSLTHARLNVVLIEYRRMVALYRSGRGAEAIQGLKERKLADWQEIVHRVVNALEQQAETKEPFHVLDVSALKNDLAHNVALARSAGALHMEAALEAYARNSTTSRAEFGDHIALGERLFGFVAKVTGQATAARRWELVLGLTAAAEGRFAWAAQVLDAASARFPDDGPLHLARGSVHETISGLPAAVLETGDAVLRGRGFSVWQTALTGSQAARDSQRAAAREALERALASLPASNEARLRLGRLRMLQGDLNAAATILGEVTATTTASVREAYLSRLFLGRVRQQQGQLDAAASTFEDALRRLPGAQSAQVALAEVTRVRGDADQAAAIAERMLAAQSEEEDPWSGYRFAQYWIRDDILAELRKEARQ